MVREANGERGFLSWVVRFLSRPKTPRWYIVEVEKGTTVTSSEDGAAIASLKHHPGVVALQNRLKLQRAVLKGRLEATRHKDIRDVDFIQSGLYWLRFLESEIDNAVGLAKNKEVVPSLSDKFEFEKIHSAIESVGTTSSEVKFNSHKEE